MFYVSVVTSSFVVYVAVKNIDGDVSKLLDC